MRTWFQGFSRKAGKRNHAKGRTRAETRDCRNAFHTLGLEQFEQRVLLTATSDIDLAITTTAAATANTILGTAGSFAVLASSTVTNTGPSVITGNLGVSPGTSLTGFGPAVINGTTHAGDAVAAQAQSDLHKAYNQLAGKPVTTNLTGQNLGGLTLMPGVYHFNSSAQLSGTLTLDAQGNPNAEFDFQIGSTLTTATGSAVHVINSGNDSNVFWQVGSSASLGTATAFEGSILAFSSITVNTGSSITDGRALAISGAVTLADNAISIPASGTVGANETYTITVKNNDAVNNATGVTMTDLLPANTTFVSATDGNGGTITQSGSTLSDAIGNLAHAATDTITVVVTPTGAGTITNTASVEGDQTDTNQANNSASVSTTVNGGVTPTIDLSITKVAAPTTGTVGVNETYTIVVTNNDTTNDATGVSMTDLLPANATFVSATDGNGGTITQSGSTLSDAIGGLVHAATDTITVVVKPTAAGTITDTASVEAIQADNNQANNSATVTTIVNGAAGPNIDLSISKMASPTTGTVDVNETYTIVVTNNDTTNDATGVSMTDLLPANATFVSASDGNGGTITQSGNTLSDAIGGLAHTATDTITVVVTPTAAGTITDTASVEGIQADSNQANNTASVTTTVIVGVTPAIDLSITKAASPTTGTVGVNETYTIVVKNNDTTNDATGVSMTDLLPANATFVSASDGNGGTITQSGNTLSDAIGNLARTATDTITVVVTPTASGTIINTASVEGNQADTNQSNNSATVTTNVNGTVTPAIDLSITKTASPTTGTVGVNETYTIVVKNNDSTNDATGVSMTDVLPANATYVSASDGNGGTITQSGNTLSDAIGNLARTATDTITVVVTPTASGTIINTASVEGNQADTNQTNNSASVTTTINPVPSPRDGTNAAFVNNLYEDLLDRQAEPAGLAAWTALLALGNSRQAVVEDFLHSPEFYRVRITGFFEAFLRRGPDPGAVQFFSNELASGVTEQVVMSQIAGSQEYFNNQGGTNGGFVTGLYNDLLGRTPDAGGFSYWSARVSQVGRQEVVREMTSADEFNHLLVDDPSALFHAIPGFNQNYYQGQMSQPLKDQIFAELQNGQPWDDVIDGILQEPGYFNASSSP